MHTTSAMRSKKRRSRVSDSNDKYDVHVDWTTVVPLGDTLAIRARDGFDDRWIEAFEVVLDEHERQAIDQSWNGIDFEYASDEKNVNFVLFVREIEPGARSFELRRTVDDLVRAANAVARVGTHVYDLARELRQPQPVAAGIDALPPRDGSVPPPPFDPLEDELDADVA
jgi:hypothetical protein